MEERTYIKEVIGGKVYMRREDLAEKYNMSVYAVRNYQKEIESESGKGKRYSSKSVVNGYKCVLINEFVFLDWISVRERWKNERARKYIEPFDPIEWARYCGNYEFPVKEITVTA